MKHVEDRIQACLDGELKPDEARYVREHCASCVDCGRTWRETAEIWGALAEAPAPALPGPLWPSLADKLESNRPSWPRFAFAGTAMAVTAVGLACGLWLGSLASLDSQEGVWPSLIDNGALWVDGSQLTLDQLYLAAGAEEGDVEP